MSDKKLASNPFTETQSVLQLKIENLQDRLIEAAEVLKHTTKAKQRLIVQLESCHRRVAYLEHRVENFKLQLERSEAPVYPDPTWNHEDSVKAKNNPGWKHFRPYKKIFFTIKKKYPGFLEAMTEVIRLEKEKSEAVSGTAKVFDEEELLKYFQDRYPTHMQAPQPLDNVQVDLPVTEMIPTIHRDENSELCTIGQPVELLEVVEPFDQQSSSLDDLVDEVLTLASGLIPLPLPPPHETPILEQEGNEVSVVVANPIPLPMSLPENPIPGETDRHQVEMVSQETQTTPIDFHYEHYLPRNESPSRRAEIMPIPSTSSNEPPKSHDTSLGAIPKIIAEKKRVTFTRRDSNSSSSTTSSIDTEKSKSLKRKGTTSLVMSNPSSSSNSRVLRAPIKSKFIAPPKQGCWNCLQMGHRYPSCPHPFRFPFCFHCGYLGRKSTECPNCNGKDLIEGLDYHRKTKKH